MFEAATSTNAPRLHPDRNFDTIACGLGDPCARLAAMELGVCCAVLEPLQAERLMCCLRAGQGPDVRACEVAGMAVRETLAVGASGCLAVEPLRAWIASCPDGSVLRVVVNGAVGPYLCRPLQMGADIVVEELHAQVDADLLPPAPAGQPRCTVAVVARTQAAWERFWSCVAKLPGFAGAADAQGALALTPAGPHDLALGAALRTASLVAQRRSDNALVAANYLAAHPQVAWVSYPGLQGDPANDAARRTFEHGFGPLVTFALVDDAPAGAPQPQPARRACAAPPRNAAQSALTTLATGARLLAAGLENPLDIVAMLERDAFAAPASSHAPA